jgi:deoxyribodipyrimidine photolyase-related protein
MKKVSVLFPIDLYDDISYITGTKVFLVEENIYFNRADKSLGSMRFNILKPIYHRASMRSYYDRIKSKGINCTYIEYNDDWIDRVKQYIKSNNSFVQFFDPVDRTLEKKLNKNFDQYDIINTPRFILTNEELEQYDGPVRQTSFYVWNRKTKNILIDDSSPSRGFGGKMTYDVDNRSRPYPGIEDDIQNDPTYDNNEYVKEAQRYVKKSFDMNDFRIWGEDDFSSIQIKFPIDTTGARSRLKYFIKNNINYFGDYQDVFLNNTDDSLLFHSGLSPMINIGLLTPEEVIDAVIDYFNKSSNKKKIIHNVEGFVRQILGWREFCRYVYHSHSDKYIGINFFDSNETLTKEWYDGSIGIAPVDTCIEKAFRFGYLHHIERLMVVCNYMTISHIKPLHMYKWFMEFSLDSYDWVMEFNVYCMGSYSDGGSFTSKPYISSSQYLIKMSDYSRYDKNDNGSITRWADDWDQLFWKFIKKHKNKIKKIGRLANLVKYIKQNLSKR